MTDRIMHALSAVLLFGGLLPVGAQAQTPGVILGCAVSRGTSFSNEPGYAEDDRFIEFQNSSSDTNSFVVRSNGKDTASAPVIMSGSIKGISVSADQFAWIDALDHQAHPLEITYSLTNGSAASISIRAGSSHQCPP